MDKPVISKMPLDDFFNLEDFRSGVYTGINVEQGVEWFKQQYSHSTNLHCYYGYRSGDVTSGSDIVIVIEPRYTDDTKDLLCSVKWWILSVDSMTEDDKIIDLAHLSRGRWCGVKWFTMDYVTGYDGEDFLKEITADLSMLEMALADLGFENTSF